VDTDPLRASTRSERGQGLTITTDGGTTFDINEKLVTIRRSDQPIIVVPLADLREFLGLLDLENGDDGFG
jgi:hypothetical protein